MHSFYSSRRIGNILILSGKEVKHYKVKRIHRKEKFIVIHNDKLYLCELYKTLKSEIWVRILEEVNFQDKSCQINLFIGVPKDIKIMDYIIRFANETVISQIIPLITSRSFSDMKVIRVKIERWKRIAMESSKQALRRKPLIINEPVNLQEVEAEGMSFVLDSFGDNYLSKELIQGNSFSVVIGPEGGFSSREVELLREKGFTPVKLKPYIMRVETAVAVIGGLLSNLCDS